MHLLQFNLDLIQFNTEFNTNANAMLLCSLYCVLALKTISVTAPAPGGARRCGWARYLTHISISDTSPQDLDQSQPLQLSESETHDTLAQSRKNCRTQRLGQLVCNIGYAVNWNQLEELLLHSVMDDVLTEPDGGQCAWQDRCLQPSPPTMRCRCYCLQTPE